jgi:hypothetical protein
MVGREIEERDLGELHALLVEGFPRRTGRYWQLAIDVLGRRPVVEGCPRFGYVLEADGRLVGVLLVLATRIDGQVRCNLSSWYVRNPYRAYAVFLFRRALGIRDAAYLNLSPAKSTLPIIEARGFKAYTGGTLIMDARAALGSKKSAVRRLRRGEATGLGSETDSMVAAHLEYGCFGFLLEDASGLMVTLYRIKWLKGFIPAAQFVMGDPTRIVGASSELLRALLPRAIFICLADAPLNYVPPPGTLLHATREVRYFMGGFPPAVGDLRETEIALFGP